MAQRCIRTRARAERPGASCVGIFLDLPAGPLNFKFLLLLALSYNSTKLMLAVTTVCQETPSHEHDVECINIFTLDVHLVSNMGLRVAIDIEGRYVQMSFTLLTYLDQYHFLIDLSIKLTDLFTIILI